MLLKANITQKIQQLTAGCQVTVP